MSITQGMTGGGSWSGRRTLRAFPRGPGFTSLGRPNLQLISQMSNTQLLVALALLPLVGPAAGLAPGLAVRGFNIATKPLFWVGVNAYEESADIRAWRRGEDMSWQLDYKIRPTRLHPFHGNQIGNVVPMIFPYLNFTKTPSSGGGEPGGIPKLHHPPLSMEETGEILTSAGQIKPTWVPPSKTKSPSRFKKAKYCPPGYYWSRSRRKCLPLEGANDYRRFKRRYRKKG